VSSPKQRNDMAGAKWISDLTPKTPLAEAARHVLTLRLQVVREFLPLAIHHAERDLEHVHQLRVGTRRARAALDIFAGCLPRKTYKAAKVTLRAIRQAAGEARDWDVFAAALADWTAPQSRHRAGLVFLHGYVQAQREAAQVHLRQLEQTLADFAKLMETWIDDVRRPRGRGGPIKLRELAQPLIRRLVRELESVLVEDPEDLDRLHELRIVGKRLRYALEVFVSCFAPAFREQLYPAVEAMQEVLGRLNDHRLAHARLESICTKLASLPPDLAKRIKPGLEERQRFHHERLAEARDMFEEWRQRWPAEALYDSA
jgi:CHAD domain-containing protein